MLVNCDSDTEYDIYIKRPKKNKNWRFDFNTLDTVPYLYANLARTFGVSQNEVANICDVYISEKWGYIEGSEIDFISDQLYSNQWNLTSIYKGNVPQIERLSYYYEYHSMFCSASDLLKNESLIKSDDWDSWKYWLNSHGNTFEQFWLSDMRDSIPLEKKYWKYDEVKFNKKWRDEIEEDYFDSQIIEKDWIIVYSSIYKDINENNENIHITSSLVSSKNSEALLRALHTTYDYRDYYISSNEEDNHSLENSKINKFGFYLKGWLSFIGTEVSGLDCHDSLFNDIDKEYIKLGSVFSKHYNVGYDTFYKNSYINGEIIANHCNWNERLDEGYRRHSGYNNSGNIFKIKQSVLIDFLNKEGKDLIVSCIIERQLKERDVNYTRQFVDNSNKIKLYLIKQDGTVKTLRGENFKIGRRTS